MSGKVKFPRDAALAVARELCVSLTDRCERLICAGSLRRRNSMVGDVELVFVPKLVTRAVDFFSAESVSLVDEELERMLRVGILRKRTNVNGSEMWGQKNKLALHVASGIPVDFFAAVEANWFNYLVCRTGGASSNAAVAYAAQHRGWKWNPYGEGFTNCAGELVRVTCERDVFEFVGLPYLEPWERP